MFTMTQLEAAFVAGLMDTDGSFGFKIDGGGKKAHASVKISQKNPLIPKWIHERTKVGTVRAQKARDFYGKRIEGIGSYRWQVNKVQDVKNLLDLIIPFLVLKQREAKALREACETIDSDWLTVAREFRVVSESRQEVRLKYDALVKGLKKHRIVSLEQEKFTDNRKAYLAGLIEGDGYVRLYKAEKSVAHAALWLGQEDESFVNWVHRLVGVGKPSSVLRRKEKFHYYWKVSQSLEVVFVLEAIIPFLLVKKREAELMLELAKTHNPNWRTLKRSEKKVTEEILQKRREIVAQFPRGGKGKARELT